jgi:hypothetical protein
MERPLSFSQWAAIAGGIAILVWSIPGLIIHPDFATGDSATTERWLAVDMNGWHAVSGFLIAIPAFISALRRSWSGLVNLVSAGGLYATAIWLLIDEQVAGGLLYLPNTAADAVLHIGTGSIFMAGAVHYWLYEREPAAALQ